MIIFNLCVFVFVFAVSLDESSDGGSGSEGEGDNASLPSLEGSPSFDRTSVAGEGVSASLDSSFSSGSSELQPCLTQQPRELAPSISSVQPRESSTVATSVISSGRAVELPSLFSDAAVTAATTVTPVAAIISSVQQLQQPPGVPTATTATATTSAAAISSVQLGVPIAAASTSAAAIISSVQQQQQPGVPTFAAISSVQPAFSEHQYPLHHTTHNTQLHTPNIHPTYTPAVYTQHTPAVYSEQPVEARATQEELATSISSVQPWECVEPPTSSFSQELATGWELEDPLSSSSVPLASSTTRETAARHSPLRVVSSSSAAAGVTFTRREQSFLRKAAKVGRALGEGAPTPEEEEQIIAVAEALCRSPARRSLLQRAKTATSPSSLVRISAACNFSEEEEREDPSSCARCKQYCRKRSE